jgi:hypothetical protein
MKSILRSSSSSASMAVVGAQPDDVQRRLAPQLEPVKGERSEFILTLDGSGRFNPCCKQRQCFIVSYQPLGRRLSSLHVPLVAPRRPLVDKGAINLYTAISHAWSSTCMMCDVGEKANWWNLERHSSLEAGCGNYLLNVPRAPINESSLT